MIAYRFGPGQRELHAVYFAPGGMLPRSTAVLLCAPFGPEAARSHRIYRVLAERLARAGFCVLRFDYFGTGDSDGEFAEGSLAAWRSDIALAHAELLLRSGMHRAAWVGLRLGATLAVQAAGDGGAQPARVIAWDPIVEGAPYLSELGQAHMDFLRRDFGLGWAAVRERVAATLPIIDQALGFALVAALRAEFAALDLTADKPPAVELRVLASTQSAALSRLQVALPQARWRHFQPTAAWNSDEAMNHAIVPAELLDAIHAELEGLP